MPSLDGIQKAYFQNPPVHGTFRKGFFLGEKTRLKLDSDLAATDPWGIGQLKSRIRTNVENMCFNEDLYENISESQIIRVQITLSETNIAPENGWLED